MRTPRPLDLQTGKIMVKPDPEQVQPFLLAEIGHASFLHLPKLDLKVAESDVSLTLYGVDSCFLQTLNICFAPEATEVRVDGVGQMPTMLLSGPLIDFCAQQAELAICDDCG